MSTEGRSFLAVFGSCGPLKPEHIPEDYIASARYIHFYQVTPATVYAAKLARKRGIKTSFDGDVYEKITEDNLDLIDILIGSEFFYVERFKDREFKNLRENCFALKRRGPEIVVITLGSRGCAGVYGDTYFESPGFPVEVVDTTGAGDVFHGAFLFGLLKGYDVEYTARFANAASAIKCTRQGGRAGIPKLAAIDRFLKDGFIDYSEIDQRVEFYKNGIWNQAAY
jgi:sugar/nucleoside kinase (ribokinase family)